MHSACWYWDGGYTPAGYGQLRLPSRKHKLAHRLAYELLVGPIPEGLQLDHLCRIRGCVNPEHLRVVTSRENLLAPGARTLAALNSAKTSCPRGHAYNDENTYVDVTGRRHCKSCNRDVNRENQRRKRNSAREAARSRAAACSSGIGEAVIAGISSPVSQRVGLPGPTLAQVIEEQADGKHVAHTELDSQRGR